MRDMIIKFKNPDEVRAFVNKVEKYPYDMDMKRGRFVVDAKSILGIMNLGFNNPIEL
ncbi:HPr family phosphocarrier protein, partial [Muricomes intestini]